ncbi:unnamed protein product [Amoebophrya sp. A120]|nr:unnamed protein product [Amoebophrya sp. A120]|eukprot:GSA120T00020059001.1
MLMTEIKSIYNISWAFLILIFFFTEQEHKHVLLKKFFISLRADERERENRNSPSRYEIQRRGEDATLILFLVCGQLWHAHDAPCSTLATTALLVTHLLLEEEINVAAATRNTPTSLV